MFPNAREYSCVKLGNSGEMKLKNFAFQELKYRLDFADLTLCGRLAQLDRASGFEPDEGLKFVRNFR